MNKRLSLTRHVRIEEKTPLDFYEDAQMKLGFSALQLSKVYEMNDKGKSFKFIADWIEAQP